MTKQQLDDWYARIAETAARGGWDDPDVRRSLRALWRAEETAGAYAQVAS